jgi:hypothetical protein
LSDHRRTLHELGSFVELRIGEEARAAQDAGDQRALSYARSRLALLTRMRADIDERPWARTEVANFLRRAARIYREHPDYVWWA